MIVLPTRLSSTTRTINDFVAAAPMPLVAIILGGGNLISSSVAAWPCALPMLANIALLDFWISRRYSLCSAPREVCNNKSVRPMMLLVSDLIE